LEHERSPVLKIWIVAVPF